jgi:MoxR-like ATPase
MTDKVNPRTLDSAINLEAMNRPEDYVMEDEALDAVARAALILGKPLLLTGEAGIGKSQFADWLALQLNLDEPDRFLGKPLKFVVKSTTEARDLFYQYDALARFHEAQVTQLQETPVAGERALRTRPNDAIDPRRYLTYNALGTAILFSLGKEKALSKGLISEAMQKDWLDRFPEKPRRSVVLIDEIDKAPRDVPNDMLDEIDHLSFSIRELGNLPVEAHHAFRPIVVMTSNSERDLPKPFLRRCVYYHMKFPSDTVLAQIVERRVGKRFHSAVGILGQAMILFGYLREEAGIRQPPGLAELLDFLSALAGGLQSGAELRSHPHLQAVVQATLLKDRHDQEQSDRDWASWLDKTLGPRDGGQ